MSILERRIQKGIRDQNAYREWEQKWEAVEKRLGGFPDKRHYQLISGSDDFGTMVWEREWVSLAASDAAYNKLFHDPEATSLGSSFSSFYSGERIEYYDVW